MKHDILAKPLTFKIMRLLSNQGLTTKEIKEKLPEVSPASLYRHIKKMHEEKLLKVIKEESINGIIQKTYTFAMENSMLSREEVKALTEKEFRSLFMQFISILIGDFDDALKHHGLNFTKENSSFSQAVFYLTEEEQSEMNKELRHTFKKYIKNKPKENRKKFLLSTLSLLEMEMDLEEDKDK